MRVTAPEEAVDWCLDVAGAAKMRGGRARVRKVVMRLEECILSDQMAEISVQNDCEILGSENEIQRFWS